jgi:hypothetical protein
VRFAVSVPWGGRRRFRVDYVERPKLGGGIEWRRAHVDFGIRLAFGVFDLGHSHGIKYPRRIERCLWFGDQLRGGEQRRGRRDRLPRVGGG